MSALAPLESLYEVPVDQPRGWWCRTDGGMHTIHQATWRQRCIAGVGVIQCAQHELEGDPCPVGKITAERLPAMLRAGGLEREAASQELRDLLVRAALFYLVRQQYPVEAFGADSYESLAEDYAHASFAIILRELDDFRGECRFTTWTYRIVINLIADEMRRRAWRRRPLMQDSDAAWSWHASNDEQDVETLADRRTLWSLLNDIIQHELTPRQRLALVGRIFDEKPLVVLADELGTDKDNVYKLVHDARKHLKRALREHGLTEADVFAAFQGRGA
jgi:RNA polymerase sigma-70 factor, ECF subfamily